MPVCPKCKKEIDSLRYIETKETEYEASIGTPDTEDNELNMNRLKNGMATLQDT